MNKENFTLFGAIFASIASSLCCLPALLFLVFGISVGSLSFLSSMEGVRVPLGVISLIFFLVWLLQRKQKMKCECTKDAKIKTYIMSGTFFILIGTLLLYPELSVYLLEQE